MYLRVNTGEHLWFITLFWNSMHKIMYLNKIHLYYWKYYTLIQHTQSPNTANSSVLVYTKCMHVLLHICNYQNGNCLGKNCISCIQISDTLSPNRDPWPCVTISSVWVHKWTWMLAYFTLASLQSLFLFSIFSNIAFTLVSVLFLNPFMDLTVLIC